jgi:hypothetical protein
MLNYNSDKPADLHELDLKHNKTKQAYYDLIEYNKQCGYCVPEEHERRYKKLKEDDSAIFTLDTRQKILYLKDALDSTDNEVTKTSIIREIRNIKLDFGRKLGISPAGIDKYFSGCPYRVYSKKEKSNEKEASSCC